MSSFANAPQNQTFSFGPPTTTTTQNQPGNYTTIVNQRMGGGLGGYGSMGGYGGATGAPFNLSAANPMGAGLGGFGGFGGMGGYGFNPMMGGGFGGFGGMGGYGFNPMMGGGFGGFGYNPMMGGGFGGFGGMGGFGYNPMMGMGLGSFGGFGGMGGFNPMMGGGFGTPFNPMPQQPPPGFEFNPDYRPRNVGPGMATTMDMRPSDEMFRPIRQPAPAITPAVEDAIISDETGQYDPNRGAMQPITVEPIAEGYQASPQLQQQQLLQLFSGMNPVYLNRLLSILGNR